MKKMCALILSVLLVLTAVPTMTAAAAQSGLSEANGLYAIKLADGTYEVQLAPVNLSYDLIGFPYQLTEITVPAEIGGIKVTAIAEKGFCPEDTSYGKTPNLKTITLPDTIKTIGDSAFSGLLNLTSINLPETLTEIGSNAFAGCTALSEITLPESLKRLGSNAFMNCTALKSISIPQKIHSLYSTFYGCSALENINIENDEIDIRGSVFYGCKLLDFKLTDNMTINGAVFENCGITEANIPAGTWNLESFAFKNCEKLKTVTIPDTVTNIGIEAFNGCSSLKNITLPPKLDTISDGILEDTSIESIVIPDGIEYIQSHAFSDCAMLSSVTIPKSVERIGPSVFSGCTSLKNITLPENLSEMGYNCFSSSGLTEVQIPAALASYKDSQFSIFDNCKNLNEITVSPDNTVFAAKDGVLYNKAMTLLVQYPAGNQNENFTAPDTVKTVDLNAFAGCSNLKQIKFSSAVSKFSAGAFCDCTALEQLPEAPSESIEVGYCAFQNCTSLTDIVIPESWENISSSVFSGCTSLKSADLSKHSVLTANMFEGCTALESVKLSDATTEITKGCFFDCSGLKSIALPAALININQCAFMNSGLESISLPNSVEFIRYHAFAGTAIKELALSEKYNYEEKNPVTSGMNELEKITVSENNPNVETVDGILCRSKDMCALAYPSNDPRTKLILPDAVTSVGTAAFDNPRNLKSIDLNKVSGLNFAAFINCRSVEKYIVGTCTVDFGDYALGYSDTFISANGELNYYPAIDPQKLSGFFLECDYGSKAAGYCSKNIFTDTLVYNHPLTAGDVDGNGTIDSADALALLQYSVGKINLTPMSWNAGNMVKPNQSTFLEPDVSFSWSYNSLLILQYSCGKITSFPKDNPDEPPIVDEK